MTVAKVEMTREEDGSGFGNGGGDQHEGNGDPGGGDTVKGSTSLAVHPNKNDFTMERLPEMKMEMGTVRK